MDCRSIFDDNNCGSSRGSSSSLDSIASTVASSSSSHPRDGYSLDDFNATWRSESEGGGHVNPLPVWQIVLFGFLACCTGFATVAGNLIVIIAFGLERSIRQPTNYFIASLAVSDLLIGSVSMPLYTIYLLSGQYWPLGEALCDLWLSIDYTACLCSIYTVFCITADRFCSVKIPAMYRKWRTGKKVTVIVGLTWLIPMTVFFTSIFGWQYFVGKRTVPKGKCYVQYMEDELFNCFLQIGYFWITLIAMIGLYAGIYRVALDLQRRSVAQREKAISCLVSMAGRTVTQIGSVISMARVPPRPSCDLARSAGGQPINVGRQPGQIHLDCVRETAEDGSGVAMEIKNNSCLATDAALPSVIRGNNIESQPEMTSQLRLTSDFGTDANNAKNALKYNNNFHAMNNSETGITHGLNQATDRPKDELSSLVETRRHSLRSTSGLYRRVSSKRDFEHRIDPECRSQLSTTAMAVAADPESLLEIGYVDEETPEMDSGSCDDATIRLGGSDQPELEVLLLRKSGMESTGGGTKKEYKEISSSGMHARSCFHHSFQKKSSTRVAIVSPSSNNIEHMEMKLLTGVVETRRTRSTTEMKSTSIESDRAGCINRDDSRKMLTASRSNGIEPPTSGSQSKFQNPLGMSRYMFRLGQQKESAEDEQEKARIQQQQLQQTKIDNRTKKALKTISIILGAFVVCWIPWHVLSMIIGFCNKHGLTCIAPIFYDISYWLCYLNSPINPFCYAFANQQFKKTFIRILKLDWHRS